MKFIEFITDLELGKDSQIYVNPFNIIYVRPSNNTNWTEVIMTSGNTKIIKQPIEEVRKLLDIAVLG